MHVHHPSASRAMNTPGRKANVFHGPVVASVYIFPTRCCIREVQGTEDGVLWISRWCNALSGVLRAFERLMCRVFTLDTEQWPPGSQLEQAAARIAHCLLLCYSRHNFLLSFYRRQTLSSPNLAIRPNSFGLSRRALPGYGLDLPLVASMATMFEAVFLEWATWV